MGRFTKLVLSDLMCYSNGVEIPLDFSEPTLITGPNGSGKSTLPETGFGWLLFGEIASGGEADSIIRDFTDSGWGELHYTDDAGAQWVLRQTRKRGNPPKVQILCDGQTPADDWARDTGGKARDYFRTRVLGMDPSFTFADFMNTCFFSADWEKYGFTARELGPAERVQIVSRLLRLPVWDRAIKQASNELEPLTREAARLEARLAAMQELVGSAKDDSAVERKQAETQIAEIQALQGKVQAIADRVKQVLEGKAKVAQLDAANTQMKVYEAAAAEFKKNRGIELDYVSTKVAELETALGEIADGKQAARTKKDAAVTKIAQVDADVRAAKDLLICPECSTSLALLECKLVQADAPDEAALAKLKKKRTTLVASRTKVEKKLADLEAQGYANRESRTSLVAAADALVAQKLSAERVLAIAKELDGVEDTQQAVVKLEAEVLSLRADFSKEPGAETVIRACHKMGLDIWTTTALSSMLSDTLAESLAKVRSIEEAQKNRAKVEQTKVEVREAQSKQATHLKAIEAMKDAKRVLIESYLPLLADEMNRVLDQIGGDYQVHLSTLSETQKGEARAKFTIEALRKSTQAVRPFKRLSQGELRRVAIASFVAMRKHSEAAGRLQGNMPYFWDEDAADNLDTVGKDGFCSLIDGLESQHFVISHDDVLCSRFQNNLAVVNEDGVVSSVVLQ